MVEKNGIKQNYSLSQKELTSVDNYRKLRETSVLTVMFTDIKGFTQLTEEKGEIFSGQVRKTHNKILIPIIEENNDGLIVKHIGDSIMAVFSEPSTAVVQAIKIQQALNEFNLHNPDNINLEVRIGLHMGQVALENEIDLDLFGRHVNRAARVEGLADGKQIYMTYPVFDSARGWIDQHKVGAVSWKKHGAYFLKGIKEPIDIYEVADTSIQKPKPPLTGRKKRGIPKIGILLSLILLGVVLSFAIMQFQKTQVWLIEFWPENVYFNASGEKLLLDDNPVGKSRKILNDVKRGDHLIYYNVSRMVRYYAPITIKRGKNNIKPDFKEYRLPSIYRTISLNKKNKFKNEIVANRTAEYTLFNLDNAEIPFIADIEISLKGEQTASGKYMFKAEWMIDLNGENICFGTKNSSEEFKESLIIYEDELHYYKVILNLCVGTNKNNANIEITPSFKDASITK